MSNIIREKAEKSIIKKYRKEIWLRFIAGIKEYELIQAGDRIAVCISGGKDSILLAKCLQELLKHTEIPFSLEFIVMDPGYSPENLDKIKYNTEILGIPATVFSTNIFNIAFNADRSPCYLCAKMRRGYLYERARELGCSKIALGHHFDDVIETTLLSMFYAAEIRTMMPKLHSTNFPGMELIRPLYRVKEASILAWQRYNNLDFLRCACRFTENREDEFDSKRSEMKRLIQNMREINPYTDTNIFMSTHNVNLETVTGYRKFGKSYSFLDEYNEGRNENNEQNEI